MIDLKEKGAPNAVTGYGSVFLLNTDFRVWLTYPQRMEALSDGDDLGYRELFIDDVPLLCDEIVEQINRFYSEKPLLPRGTGSNEKVLDFDIDADYIWAAFMQVYGIDLLDCDLHWHKFIVMLNAMPKDTMLSAIISYRTYTGDDKEFKELRYKWSLPTEYTDEEKAQIEEFNRIFG